MVLSLGVIFVRLVVMMFLTCSILCCSRCLRSSRTCWRAVNPVNRRCVRLALGVPARGTWMCGLTTLAVPQVRLGVFRPDVRPAAFLFSHLQLRWPRCSHSQDVRPEHVPRSIRRDLEYVHSITKMSIIQYVAGT
jgi:hypothetical protein